VGPFCSKAEKEQPQTHAIILLKKSSRKQPRQTQIDLSKKVDRNTYVSRNKNAVTQGTRESFDYSELYVLMMVTLTDRRDERTDGIAAQIGSHEHKATGCFCRR